ncbi:MAG: hypothetical protein HC828_15500, partial [Blastochloris sp.]|nr:hypothetical protein [Blastochloris sp.]
MYTTREFVAEEGEGESAVNALNMELEQNGAAQTITTFMQGTPNYLGTFNGVNFSAVPGDAPELAEVMERFAHEMEAHGQELYKRLGRSHCHARSGRPDAPRVVTRSI